MNKPNTLFSRATPHESAHLHVSGEATYIDDIPELAGTLFCALGLSQKAHARINKIDLSAIIAMPGVVAVLQASDIQGVNDCGPILHDDPILVDDVVEYIGQPIFAVVAKTYQAARQAAVKGVVDYTELPAVYSPEEAKAQNSYVIEPMACLQGQPEQALKKAPRRLKGKFNVGGQEQFYLEGQISYAIPREDNSIYLHCSTQHPSEMQHIVAHALGLKNNQVTVEIRRMGGGFGGKESQSAIFACIASVCARKLNRPVKLRLDRDDDMMITGKRHCFYYEYDVGFDDKGRILAADIDMTLRAGFSTDLSPPVAARAVCHFDNAYYLSDVHIKARCGKTNTQSNTAFRGFGGPQGAIAIEIIIDNIARELGKDVLAIRKLNFYGKTDRNVTPYEQTVQDNVIHELVAQLEISSGYAKRKDAISSFNQTSPILKKGIALTPLKFGISFNVVHFNQAGALVHVYLDGSILVNHGGTEMGQGINTKVAQVVANELGVSLEYVKSTATQTDKVANTSATAASTGADLNAKAAEDAARQIKIRIANFAAEKYGGTAEEVEFIDNCVNVAGNKFGFNVMVVQAYENRVQLWSDGFYKTPDLSWDKDKMKGRPFYYFAYGASVSEVVVDTLTGEWKLLRADLLHDAGNSINPAIDLGQVEGAFIQGMGWLTTEELFWNDSGKLMTHAPSTYKIPAVNDCPKDFRVNLFKNINHENTIMRSKAVGEPPLLLAFSVFLAIRDAIASTREHKFSPDLDAPATSERILKAITDLKAA